MGVWGSGPFENDDALDWVWELQEAEVWNVVETALDGAVDASMEDDLEVLEGQLACAAAAVVAATRDPTVSLPDEASEWLSSHRGALPVELRSKATGALGRVIGPGSELAELWREAGNADWLRSIERLRNALA